MADQPLDLTPSKALKDGGRRLISFVLFTITICVGAGAWAFDRGVYAVMGTILGAVVAFSLLWRVYMPEASFPTWIRLWHDRNVRGYTLWVYENADGTLHREVYRCGAYIGRPSHRTALIRLPLGGWHNRSGAYWPTGISFGSCRNFLTISQDTHEPTEEVFIHDWNGSCVSMNVADALAFLRVYMTRLDGASDDRYLKPLAWSKVVPALVHLANATPA